MIAIVVLLSFIAATLILRVAAAQVQDGETLHDLTVRVHTLRNEYVAHLRGDEIIEVDEFRPPATPPAGQIGAEPSRAQAA